MATRIRRAPEDRAERSAEEARESGTLPRAPAALPVIAGHGGCGATTLARFLGDGAEEAHVDPAGQLVGVGAGPGRDFAGIGATPLGQWRRESVVVVGQGTAYGAAKAAGLAGQLTDHGLLVVVAIVGDGPLREPVAVRARARAMRGWTLDVVRVPYVARWRFLDQPVDPPGDFLAAIEQIRAATRQRSGTGPSRRQTKRKDRG